MCVCMCVCVCIILILTNLYVYGGFLHSEVDIMPGQPGSGSGGARWRVCVCVLIVISTNLYIYGGLLHGEGVCMCVYVFK